MGAQVLFFWETIILCISYKFGPYSIPLISKLDTNAIHYCLIVSAQHNQRSLCTALPASSSDLWSLVSSNNATTLRRNGTIVQLIGTEPEPIVVCTAKKNRVQLQGLRPNRQYFMDLFGVHTRKDSLIFRMASTSVWFNRSQPQQLADDVLLTAKLSEMGRQTVFSYKVPPVSTQLMPAKSTAASAVTQIQLLPCSIGLLAKVFRKKVLLAQMEIERPTNLLIADTRPGDRLVIKVSTADKYEYKRSQRFGVRY